MQQSFDDLLDAIKNDISQEITGHTRFQIENFIIKAEPTDYGQYKQCVKELRGREKQCRTINEEIEKLNTKMKSGDLEPSEYHKRLSEHQILLEDIKRETYIFYDIFLEIKERIDLENREELEIEYWNARFEKLLLTHWISGAPLPISLIESIQCLPSDKCPVVQKMYNALTEVRSLQMLEKPKEAIEQQ